MRNQLYTAWAAPNINLHCGVSGLLPCSHMDSLNIMHTLYYAAGRLLTTLLILRFTGSVHLVNVQSYSENSYNQYSYESMKKRHTSWNTGYYTNTLCIIKHVCLRISLIHGVTMYFSSQLVTLYTQEFTKLMLKMARHPIRTSFVN